jgi:hypothetical protein
MSEEPNVFSRAANTLSKVEQFVVSGRETLDAVESSRSSTDKATREIQSIRSEVLSARNDFNTAVQQLRELDTQLRAAIDKNAEEIRLESQRVFRRMSIMMTVLMVLTFALGAAASYPLLLEYGFMVKP